jgi:hypothetical protein
MVIKPSPAMKTPNAMLMVASMGRALFTVKEGEVKAREDIAVVTVGLANWIRRGRLAVYGVAKQ